MKWFVWALKRWNDWSGRSRRREYGWFYLISVVVLLALAFIDGMIGSYTPGIGLGLLSGIFWLVTLVPTLAITVRRLHDLGWSGWLMLLFLIPLANLILLLLLLFKGSQPGDNKYGPEPQFS